jgi:hypothetical protein
MIQTSSAVRRSTDLAISSYTTLRRRAVPALEQIVGDYAKTVIVRLDQRASGIRQAAGRLLGVDPPRLRVEYRSPLVEEQAPTPVRLSPQRTAPRLGATPGSQVSDVDQVLRKPNPTDIGSADGLIGGRKCPCHGRQHGLAIPDSARGTELNELFVE